MLLYPYHEPVMGLAASEHEDILANTANGRPTLLAA